MIGKHSRVGGHAKGEHLLHRKVRAALQVVRGAGADGAGDNLLRRAAAEHHHHVGEHCGVRLILVELAAGLLGVPKRVAAGEDGDLQHILLLREEPREERVAGLVDSGAADRGGGLAAALLLAQDRVVDGLEEVGGFNEGLVLNARLQRGFIHDRRESGGAEAGR